jgi:hypothetical protein
MATSHTTTVTTQTAQTKQQRRIIERLSIILVCCGITLIGVFLAFVETMGIYSASTGFERTEPLEYITMLGMLVYAINLAVQAVYVIIRTLRSAIAPYRQQAAAFVAILGYFVALATVYLYHHYAVQDGFGPHTFLQTTAGAALGLTISGIGSLYLWYVLLRTRKGQVVRS